MDWYEIYKLIENLKEVRSFLIKLASVESEIEYFGLSVALRIDNFETVRGCLDELPERFAAIKRQMSLLDDELFNQLNALEKEDKLIEQLSLINLKIQMAKEARRSSIYQAKIMRSLLAITKLFVRGHDSKIFGTEKISIEKTIVSTEKLTSTLKIAEAILRNREGSDDEIFKPSNIEDNKVSLLIERAIVEINNSTAIGMETKRKLVGYLQEAKIEVASGAPKWSKIVGALVIVAAITSGLADASAAAKSVQEAIEYILGASVEKPLHRYLPQSESSPDDSPSISLIS